MRESGLYGQIAAEKNTTKEKQQAEEICLDQDTRNGH